jgi:hypothetical protein
MVARTLVKAIKAWPDEDFAELVALVLQERERRAEGRSNQKASKNRTSVPRDIPPIPKRLPTGY